MSLGALAAGAAADPGKASGPAPKAIDAAAVRDQLEVFRDDAGHYVIAKREAADDATDWVFFGDGKVLYQQRVFGYGTSGASKEFNVWAPRVSEQNGAAITLGGADGPSSYSCGPKLDHALTQLPADQAKAFLARAKLMPPLWQRASHLLLRDDLGTYYFVDAIRDELGGGGHRLFVGKRDGRLKEQPLTAVVSDPAGEVFTTKDGALKTFGAADKPPVWRAAGSDKPVELTALDLTEPQTRLMIYREFGIYGALGTPCD